MITAAPIPLSDILFSDSSLALEARVPENHLPS